MTRKGEGLIERRIDALVVDNFDPDELVTYSVYKNNVRQERVLAPADFIRELKTYLHKGFIIFKNFYSLKK